MKNYTLVISLLFLLLGCRNQQNQTAITTLDDLKNARIATLLGSTQDAYATIHFPKATILRFETETDLYVALDNNKADVVMFDEQIFKIEAESTGKYRILSTVYSSELGIGFGLSQTELRDNFNSFFTNLKENGTYDQLLEKWLGKDQATANMPNWSDSPKETPLKIGFTGSTQGFGFIKDGKPAGLDVELLTLFGRSIDRPVEFLPINFGGLIAALASNKVDIIAASISITPERSKQVAFSIPYFSSHTIAVVRNEESGNKSTGFISLEEAQNARIAVVSGNLHDLYVTKNFPKASPIRLDTYADVLMSLESGKADVACVEGVVYNTALKQKGIYRNIGVLFDDPYGVGFNKNNPELRDNFNAFLDELKQNGTLDEMNSRWIEQYNSARMPVLEKVSGGKPIRVGCCAATEVFDFIQDNQHAGFDIELAERFGRYLGRPVEFLTINFGGLISALSSNRVDMICSAITINEERGKQINFSKPYFISQSIAIVMDKTQSNTDKKSKHDGSDVATARLATMTGTTSEIFITKEYPKAELLCFDDINDAFLALQKDKADYVLTSYTTSLLAAKNSHGLILLPKEYIRDPAGIAFNKKDTTLLREINEIILRFKEDGTLKDIVDRWIKPDGSDYQPKDVPEVKQGKPLKIGIAANREPMCFISNGKISGLDAELVERIAFELGRPVEYSDMKFSALIAAIESGRVDLVISNFSVTQERLKRVNFSESYFTNPQVLTIFSPDTQTAQTISHNWFSKIKESFNNNLVIEKRYMLILNGLKQTIIITFFSIILGTIVGGLICFLRMNRNKLAIGFAKIYISLMRGTPILVLLMIFFYVIFASTGLSATLVAIITFALNMGAYSSEMFRTSIQSIDKSQTEAGIALGFTKIQTFIYVVFPQALKRVIPVYKGEVISLLKMTSIVGYVAVVDLTKASDLIRSRTFDAFFPLIVVAVIYFLLAWLLGIALDKLNRKMI